MPIACCNLMQFLILFLICIVLNFLVPVFYPEALWYPESLVKCYIKKMSFNSVKVSLVLFTHKKRQLRFENEGSSK